MDIRRVKAATLRGLILPSVCTFLLCTGIGTAARAGVNEWTRTAGPFGSSEIRVVAIDPVTPETLYAGSDDRGIFRSTDGGRNWQAASKGLPAAAIRALVIDPQAPSTLYAGTLGFGIFKSNDAGVNWQAINAGLPSSSEVRALAVDPVTTTTVYAGTADDGIFKSTDGGVTWTAANNGMTGDFVTSLAIDSATPSTLYVANFWGGVFKSTNAGLSWSAANTGLDDQVDGDVLTGAGVLVIDPSTPSTLYVCVWMAGVFKSTDGAASWSLEAGARWLSDLASGNVLAVDSSNPDIRYGRRWEGRELYKTKNGGESWELVLEGGSVVSFLVDPANPNTVYAGTTGRSVFKTTDGGKTWVGGIRQGIEGDRVHLLMLDPGTPATLYARTSWWETTLYRSVDSGVTWQAFNEVPGIAEITAVAIDSSTPATMYIGFWASDPDYFGGIMKSTDAATAWQTVNEGLPVGDPSHGTAFFPWIGSLAIDPHTPTTVYATVEGCYVGAVGGGCLSSYGVFKSVDGGLTWNPANDGLPTESVGMFGWVDSSISLAIDSADPNTLYTDTSEGIYKSTDGGVSWAPASHGLPKRQRVIALAAVGRDTVYALTDRIYKSINGGVTWRPLNRGLPPDDSLHCLAIDPQDPRTLYAANDEGVFRIDQVEDRCVGDCDENGEATIDDLLTLVNVALGSMGAVECSAGDWNADGQITVDEILTALIRALDGCPAVARDW
jgi:photosystem II stability/assembly factor-like uncharacterized protein